MSVKVYFGGLSESMTEDKFRQLLAGQEVGIPDTEAVTIKPGYGFAMYDSEQTAAAAIAKFNGFVHNGFTMVAEIAKDSDKKRSAGYVKIENVLATEDQKTLESLLAKYGRVEAIEFQDTESRCATVLYQTREEAEQAVKMLNESEFCDSEMSARMMTDAEKSEAQKRLYIAKKGSPINHGSKMSPTQQQKRPVDFPLRILVQSDMVGAIIGREGVTIRQITQQSRARVDIHRKENLGMVEKAITIYGQPTNCSEACLQIMKVMQQEARDTGKPEEMPLKILAHNNLVGRIIGKQGATIKRIMNDTDTKITVSSINEINAFNVERIITVKGEVEDMSRAETEISMKLRAAYEGDYQALAVYSGLHPAMMGIGYGSGMPMGGHVRGSPHMGAQPSGNVPYYAHFNNSHAGAVAAGGQGTNGHADPNNGLATAMGGMALAGRGGPIAAFQAPQESCNIFIPSSSVGAVIGTKGTYIRQVIRLTGATIKIGPNDEPSAGEAANGDGDGGSGSDGSPTTAAPLLPPSSQPVRRVTISGTIESQLKAQFCIFEKVHEDQYAAGNPEIRWNLEVMVPSVHVGRIIGRSGANVRDLQRKTGTMIKLPEEGVTKGEETPVLIMGPVNSVLACQARLREMTREAINTYNSVPPQQQTTSSQHYPVNGSGHHDGGDGSGQHVEEPAAAVLSPPEIAEAV